MEDKILNIDENAGAQFSGFTAFISYSHADSALAKKLHNKIETYTLPKRLREDYPAMDGMLQSNRKIGPIFRDREDLPAGKDLSDAVKAALQQSRVLIILCSPAAAKSPWVAKEIETFKAIHPDRPILAAIIGGEPSDCFPAPLIADGTEPLAADLRKSGDGWKLGFLKLIAGIADVPLDALIQRDAQRKLRSVMAVTLMSGIALLAMIGMTIFAFQQRNEAQDQRVAAEGLINFMLTDLRDELNGASTLRVKTKVNHRALEYYSDQGDLSGLPDDSLGQRAIILLALGEDDEKRGDLDAALEKFIEAHRATEELLAREPNNTDRIYEHAQSEYWVGYAAWREIKPDLALPYFENYAKLSKQLLATNHKNIEWIMEAGYAHSNVATVLMRGKGNYIEAKELFQKALAYFQQAVKLDADDHSIKREEADAYGWLSDASRANGDIDEAQNYREKERDILLSLAKKEPDNIIYKTDLLGNARGISQIFIDLGQNDKAIDMLNEAAIAAQKLIVTLPDDEKLAKQHMALRLFSVKADFSDNQKLSKQSRSTLNACINNPLVRNDDELLAFCNQLRNAVGMSNDRNIKFQSAYPSMKLSPRWGIDFDK